MLILFHIFAQNKDSGYTLESPHLGGSNEHPQSIFKSKTKTIMYTPVNPNYYIKDGSRGGGGGSTLHGHASMMGSQRKEQVSTRVVDLKKSTNTNIKEYRQGTACLEYTSANHLVLIPHNDLADHV